MSSKPLQFSKHQKELLTCGYIRENSKVCIPVALNNLCLNYFDEVFQIVLYGNALNNFLTMKQGQHLLRTFKYNNDVSFELELFPNGESDPNHAFTMLFTKVLVDNTQIANVRYVFRIKCDQIGCVFESNGYHDDDDYKFSWVEGFCSLSDIKLCSHSLKKLVFDVYVDIDCILYHESDLQCNWSKPLKMDKTTGFNIKMDDLSVFKDSEWRCGRSYNVDDHISSDGCWCVQFYPKGERESDEGNAIIIISLLRWNESYKEVQCKCVASYNGEEKRRTDYLLCHANAIAVTLDPLSDADVIALDFSIQIEIIEITGYDNQIIDVSVWQKQSAAVHI